MHELLILNRSSTMTGVTVIGCIFYYHYNAYLIIKSMLFIVQYTILKTSQNYDIVILLYIRSFL